MSVCLYLTRFVCGSNVFPMTTTAAARKLSTAQRKALTYLAQNPWSEAPGRPTPTTRQSLERAGLIISGNGAGTVLTDAGRAALAR